MPDFLLIRGGEPQHAVDALWAAAELVGALGDDAQVDIATTVANADYLRISAAVRRVIGVSAPDLSAVAGLSLTKTAAGWPASLLGAAKKVANAAGANARAYAALASELRLLRYDAVFDFDSSAFSVAIARLAKAEKIIGFDDKNIANPLPGANLMRHEIRHIAGEMSDSMRMRQLVARQLGYSPQSRDWKIPTAPPPDFAPTPPYVVFGGKIPEVFLRTLRDGNMPVVGAESLTAKDIVGLAQNAAIVFGNGVVAALSALIGAKTLFIGSQRDAPEGATYISTPADLEQALRRPPALAAADDADNSAGRGIKLSPTDR